MNSAVEREASKSYSVSFANAVDKPRELLSEVVREAPPATAVFAQCFLGQSTHLEPKALRDASEAVGFRALPESLVAGSDFLEASWWALRITYPYTCASKGV
jgi:hypothetical protein